MKSHTIPTRPWSKISADLFQLNRNNYLVMVDHYSDYIELRLPQQKHHSSLSDQSNKVTVCLPWDLRWVDNRQWPTIQNSRILKICSRIWFHHSQIITLLKPGKWESRVSNQNCQEHPEEISKRGSLSGSPSIQKHASTGLQLLTSSASHGKKTQRYHPYSRPPTHPSGSIPKSGVWKHCRKKVKINGSVQQEGLAAP